MPARADGEYRCRAVYRPGESFTLPESVGATVELDVTTLLGLDRHRRSRRNSRGAGKTDLPTLPA
jgi:hypothetical protein